jgi:hypothetical protein
MVSHPRRIHPSRSKFVARIHLFHIMYFSYHFAPKQTFHCDLGPKKGLPKGLNYFPNPKIVRFNELDS